MAKSRGISRKSELSPSVTQGSNRIDLGKNSDINLGQKSQPSTTSGGIGITQEVTSIGGTSVSAGIEIDITPVDFGVTVDPSQNTIAVAGGAEVPGGLIGISGGVEIDIGTGKIVGGSIGGEIGGLGINVSNSEKGGLGIEFTVQIPGTPIELSLGFGFPPKEPPGEEEPTPTPTPSPSPSPSPTPGSIFGTDPSSWEKPVLPEGDPSKSCTVVIAIKYSHREINLDGSIRHLYEENNSGSYSSSTNTVNAYRNYNNPPFGTGTQTYLNSAPIWGASGKISVFNRISNTSVPNDGIYQPADILVGFSGKEPDIYARMENVYIKEESKYSFYTYYKNRTYTIVYSSCSVPDTNTPSPSPSPSPSPFSSPFPNPLPRKQNMDACCRDAILLGRANRRFLQELMIMLGRPLDAKGNLAPLTPESKFFGEPIERVKTPIENIVDPEIETIKFNNYYELQMYQLKQQIDLDVGIDPQSFVAPTGKLQNPYYQRDSEQSLETNVQPDEDKAGNKRELQIGEDIKINSLAQQQQYLFEAVKRLEYLFPFGELSDAQFEKSLIIPGATGTLQIHNLIHFKEFLIQFLNSTLGNPKIPIKVADTNALKEGNQEGTFNHFSISHMIRELYKVVLESGDDINALMETTIRDLRTNLANRIQIVQIAEMTQALIEDSGMLENQVFVPIKLEGDPYAGKWKPGMGFQPDEDLDSKTEAATEKLMRATLKNFEAQVKVIRRDKRENADVRDLLLQLAECFIRSTAIPATKEGIEKAVAAARFKIRVENALSRSQVKRAAAAKLSRTKKKKKS